MKILICGISKYVDNMKTFRDGYFLLQEVIKVVTFRHGKFVIGLLLILIIVIVLVAFITKELIVAR